MKRTKYPIHPDFRRWTKLNPPLNRAVLPVMQRMMGALFRMQRTNGGVEVTRCGIPSADGSMLRALLYTPKDAGESAPALVYYHGGGFVIPAAPHHYSLAREYAVRAGCKVLFPDYRLAPKYPFPNAPEDSYAAYMWLGENAARLGIDASRIAVAGDSAGGCLATVVCLMARESGASMPCAQMLIYPVTGLGLETESMRKYTDTPMCNSRDAEKYDKLYVQDAAAGKLEYRSPMHAESPDGLPPAYIETAEFDCLRDGGIMYAEKLRRHGIPAELNNTEGTMHGFDIVLKSPIVRDCADRRIAFLREAFAGERQG